eukprot:4833660-Pleurochrysis_carterae.AAC.1
MAIHEAGLLGRGGGGEAGRLLRIEGRALGTAGGEEEERVRPRYRGHGGLRTILGLSLIHISEPTRRTPI